MTDAQTPAVEKEPKLQKVPGGWLGRFRGGKDTKRKRIVIRCPEERQAESRARRMREVVRALVASKKVDPLVFLEQAAGAPDANAFRGVCRAALALASRDDTATAGPVTFRDVSELWLTGVLHQRFPGAFRKQNHETADNTRKILVKHVYPIVGDLAVRNFTLNHFHAIMARLPKEITARNKIARPIDVILRGAVELELITHNPIKRSAIPPARDPDSIAFTYLYPDEEEALIRCPRVPEQRRVWYGFMTRNGTRPSEAALLQWRDVDLDKGTVNLDDTKSDTPRMWKVDADVLAMLRRIKPADALPTDLVFPGLPGRTNRAGQLRRDLQTAGCSRATLGLGRKNPFAGRPRRPLRAHDLRATFVTVALASGWTEAQVKDRTGHETDVMLARYKRRATNAIELGHGNWFAPLDACLWPSSGPSEGSPVGRKVGQIIPLRPKKAALHSSSTTADTLQVHAGTAKTAGIDVPAGRSKRGGPPLEGGAGHAIADLTAAIVAASKAGKWTLVERLTRQLEGLEAASG